MGCLFPRLCVELRVCLRPKVTCGLIKRSQIPFCCECALENLEKRPHLVARPQYLRDRFI